MSLVTRLEQGSLSQPTWSASQKGLLLGLLATVLFSMTLPATRWSVQFFDPIAIGFGRSAIASIIAAALLRAFNVPWPSARQIRLLLLTACGVVLGFPVLSALAMKEMGAAQGGVLMGILPLLTAVFGSLLNHERNPLGFWLCSLAGALVVIAFSCRGGATSVSFGDFVLMLGILLSAIGYALGGKLSAEMPGWQVICWALVFTAPITWSGYLWFGVAPLQHSFSGWLAFIYLALVSQLFGFFLWNKGLALGGISRVSQIQLLQPFFTLLLAGVFLGEVIDLWTLMCAALVVTLVYSGRRFKLNQEVKL